ncbi:PLP-dependent transferase [Polyplosphaeria fusca]|uniref:PLP-dependent transferase n=1 Tax=Polyplosphaeria fusca TaxID=682080 RepID=A0A9P4V0R4_9PLEO|nr:PLP-dependent transferase [Polyplosphaeria fusca]
MTLKKVTVEEGSRKKVKFGRQLRKDFLFDEKWVNLNHGSFGTYPHPIRTALRAYQDATESRPDAFIRQTYSTLLDRSRHAISHLLHAPVSTIVYVPNVTTAFNTILRNLTFSPGDHILYFSPIYGACEKTIAYMTETTPVSSIRIPFTYPVEDAWLVQRFHETVDDIQRQGGRVVLAVFDTVVSAPGVRMPFEDLTVACRERGVLSCIDAAHGVGHIALDVGALDPDFLFSNAHKWLFAPRGCAVLYVPERHHGMMRSTLPTSHGFEPRPQPGGLSIYNPFEPSGKSAFVNNFEFVGTVDGAPYLCVLAALEYREGVGGEEKILEYCHGLAKEAGLRTAEIFGTEMLQNSTGTLTDCGMSNVRLPLDFEQVAKVAAKGGMGKERLGFFVRDWMQRTMMQESDTFMGLMWIGGQWWVRWSAQIYLELADFEWGAETLKRLCARVEKGEFLGAKEKL